MNEIKMNDTMFQFEAPDTGGTNGRNENIAGQAEVMRQRKKVAQEVAQKVQDQLTPVAYGGETFEQNPLRDRIPAADTESLKKAVAQIAQGESVGKCSFAVNLPLAVWANVHLPLIYR